MHFSLAQIILAEEREAAEGAEEEDEGGSDGNNEEWLRLRRVELPRCPPSRWQLQGLASSSDSIAVGDLLWPPPRPRRFQTFRAIRFTPTQASGTPPSAGS